MRELLMAILSLSDYHFCRFFFFDLENSPNLNYLIAGGGEHYGVYDFTLSGEESKVMLNKLVGQYSKSKKREKYIWKIKKIEIPGLDKPVTLQIHQGLSGKRENFTGYFTTFMNEADKKNKLTQKTIQKQPQLLFT